MDSEASSADKLRLTIGILIAFLFAPLMGHFLFVGAYNARTIFYSRFLFWIEVAMLFGYTRWIEQGDFFIWPSIRYDLKFYLGSFGALYLLVIGAGIVSNLPRLFGVPANRQMIQLMATLLYHNMPLLILSVFTAGFTEEMIFRAYLVPRLEIIFNNKYMPVLISALMFAALHFRYHSLEELLFAFLFGVVFAIHYQWYRNITILIITHAIVDLVAFLLTGFAEAYKHAHHIVS